MFLWLSPRSKFHEFVGPFVKRWHFCVSLFIRVCGWWCGVLSLFHCQSSFTDYNIQVTTQDDKMDFAVITDLCKKKRISPTKTMDAHSYDWSKYGYKEMWLKSLACKRQPQEKWKKIQRQQQSGISIEIESSR